MAIYFVTGLPRTGKTLFTLCHVRPISEKEKRPVYTCNIPGITIPGWQEIDHPDKWMDVPDGSIIIVDELQDFWGKAPPGAKVPLPILELSKHGKRGIDFYFITQEPDLVHHTPRSLCQHHYFVVRAFGSQNVMIYKFERMQLHPDKVKTKGEKMPWRYNKEAFGWYKSADTHNVKRQIPLKVWAIPFVAIFAALAVWAGIKMFGGVLDKAKSAGSPPSSSVGAVGSAGGAGGAGARSVGAAGADLQKPALTVAEYTASFDPRLKGFPQSAPRYDDLTKAAQAPKPAACIDGIRPGQQVRSCTCWTQQATPLSVPEALCKQLAAGGFFDDTLPPSNGLSTAPVVNSLAPSGVSVALLDSVGSRPVATSGSGYGLRDGRRLEQRNASVQSVLGHEDSVKAVQ